jgi:hypothetical protein
LPKVDQAHLDVRRQQIINAARDRVASDGFANTSVAAIVTESGLSRATPGEPATSRSLASTADLVAGAQDLPARVPWPVSWSWGVGTIGFVAEGSRRQ